MNENLRAFHKRACLERAKELLARNDDRVLRYVCLELRLLLEAIAYEKLRIYAVRLPEAVLNTWQPPQVIRALLEFEPRADQNFELRVARELAPGVPSGEWRTLGTHRTLRLSWLRETYNQLGSYLHVPCPGAADQPTRTGPSRGDLEQIVAELQVVVESTVDASLAAVLYVECSVCHGTTVANAETARKRQKVECLNPNCRAEFFPEFGETGEVTLSLMVTPFDCLGCGRPIQVENRRLELGHEFICPECNAKHRIAAREWGYGLLASTQSTSG